MERIEIPTFFLEQVTSNETLARVSMCSHGIYQLYLNDTVMSGVLAGKFHYHTTRMSEYPAVGDWVTVDVYEEEQKAVIQKVLDRKTCLSRNQAGGATEEQVIAANVDIIFIVTALTKEFNVRRMERYIQQVYESGAVPVIVCTKKDVGEQVDAKIGEVERIAPGIPVHVISNVTGEGIDRLVEECRPGSTISLVGSSGVGKSSLINRLLNEEIQVVKDVRQADDRGRHTTTHRELFSLLNGAWVIDTPGMRELQLWGEDESAISDTFSDIDVLSQHCKFRDCKHEKEPGCAVLQAIEAGQLDQKRLVNYNKLKRELHRLRLKEKFGTQRTNRILYGPKKQ